MVSLEKTTISFSKNVNHTVKSSLGRMSGFKVVDSMGKYLGVLLLGKSPRQHDNDYLIDKFKDKLIIYPLRELLYPSLSFNPSQSTL